MPLPYPRVGACTSEPSTHPCAHGKTGSRPLPSRILPRARATSRLFAIYKAHFAVPTRDFTASIPVTMHGAESKLVLNRETPLSKSTTMSPLTIPPPQSFTIPPSTPWTLSTLSECIASSDILNLRSQSQGALYSLIFSARLLPCGFLTRNNINSGLGSTLFRRTY
jgi:hypothetical protein